MSKIIFGFISIVLAGLTYSQDVRTTVNGYGHFDLGVQLDDNAVNSEMSIGEHDLFVNSVFKEDISFLGEFTVEVNKHSGFKASIQRARLKFQYYQNHSLIIGKMHTPVNYWNDVYHHGRLFFPTVNRPIALSHFTPLHTLGFRLQGQNLGDYNFGYDVVVGSGLAQNDIDISLNTGLSLTAAFHFKPIEGMRIGGAYYYNSVSDASQLSSHVLHDEGMNPLYTGSLQFHLANSSIAYFTEKIEVLNEFSYNATSTDSLGLAHNFSNYMYAGLRIKDRFVPYVAVDFLVVSDNDLHLGSMLMTNLIIGYKHEFSPNFNIKSQVEYRKSISMEDDHSISNFGLRIQCSYGF